MQTTLKSIAHAGLATAVLLAGVFALTASPVYAQSVNCNNPGEDLQKEIDAAKPGAELFVVGDCDDGRYVIAKDLKLIGNGNTTLSAPGPGIGEEVVLVLGRASVEFSNLNVTADGRVIGIQVVRGSTATFRNVLVEGASGPAISVGWSATVLVESCELRDNGTGVQVFASSSAEILGSRIENNAEGVTVANFSSAAVQGNWIINNTPGSGLVASLGQTYGTISAFTTPNTIEGNGTDVVCRRGGVFSAQVPQISSTATTFIDSGCVVNGTIFAP